MPASKEEKSRLFELGIPIFTGFKPAEILGSNGAVCAIKGIGMNDHSEMILECDTVILSVGQEAEDIEDFANLVHDEKGIATDLSMTSEQGIFACGDIIGGEKTAVYAIKSGKDAANRITEYLNLKKQETVCSEVRL